MESSMEMVHMVTTEATVEITLEREEEEEEEEAAPPPPRLL